MAFLIADILEGYFLYWNWPIRLAKTLTLFALANQIIQYWSIVVNFQDIFMWSSPSII